MNKLLDIVNNPQLSCIEFYERLGQLALKLSIPVEPF